MYKAELTGILSRSYI